MGAVGTISSGWGGSRLRRRSSPQEADEQRMRRRPITPPRRRHQSIKQILLAGHGLCKNRQRRKYLVALSAVTIAYKPGLPISCE
jgi:hypothetical protein